MWDRLLIDNGEKVCGTDCSLTTERRYVGQTDH